MGKIIKAEVINAASKLKCFVAGTIDLLVILLLLKSVIQFAPSPIGTEALRAGVIFLYFFLFIIVIPQAVFSQTVGKFILGMKVVSKTRKARLSFMQSLTHSVLLGAWKKSVVVSVR